MVESVAESDFEQKMWKCVECGFEQNAFHQEHCERCQTPRDPATFIGTQIGQWRLEGLLGEGGMAVVFLARHVMLGTKVAIKVLRSDLGQKREVIERFRTEALAASHLRHENIIQVMDFGYQKGIGFYMVLEFLEGDDLESVVEHGEPLSAFYVAGVAKQIAAGLSVAHDAGIIHRDLKPSNIFLVPREGSKVPLVKILDFGIAKVQESELLDEDSQNLTRTGTVLGTPFYLSPEQLTRRTGMDLGPSVDVYAFGVILYQMVSGVLPIEEANIAQQMVAILTQKPPRVGEHVPTLSDTALELFLQRMLAKVPNSRPATALEVWQELEQALGVLENKEDNATLLQQWEQIYRPLLDEEEPVSFFHRWRWAFVAVFLLCVAGGSWWASRALFRPPKPPPLLGIPKLKQLALKDFQDKKYASALLQFSQVINNKNWKRSKAYDPKILRLMGEATYLKRKENQKKLNYASMQFYKLYLQEAKGIEPQEKKQIERNIQMLSRKVLREQNFLKQALKRVDQFMQSGQDNKVLAQVGNLFDTRGQGEAFMSFRFDASLTDAYVQSARVLEKRFPKLSLSMLRKATQVDLPPNQTKALQRRLIQTQRKIRTRQNVQLQVLKKALAETQAQQARTALEEAIRNNVDDPKFLARVWKALAFSYYRHPRFSREILPTYRNVMRGLARSAAYRKWYRRWSTIPAIPVLRQTLRSARLGEKGILMYRKGQDLLTQNVLKRGMSMLQRASKSLRPATALRKSKLFPLFTRLTTDAESLRSRYTRGMESWKQVEDAFANRSLAEAQRRFQPLLASVKFSPLEKLFVERFQDQLQAFRKRCLKTYKRAQRNFARLRLKEANEMY
ncbi:MAG: protein kinase, partial [Myxococcota bacterium]